jgi:uncharacterized damage-inducible protein DinB
MTRTIDPVIRELDGEALLTRKVLERIPLEKADWKPHPKSTSLGALAAWLSGAPGWVAQAAPKDGFDFLTWQPLPVPASTEALLATFDQGVKAARAMLENIDDRAAAGDWTFRMGPKTLSTYSRIDFIRLFLISDAIHHRGQMSVYLRLLDVPVPSIYGPSADENPFG